jgi:hypothetical protein
MAGFLLFLQQVLLINDDWNIPHEKFLRLYSLLLGGSIYRRFFTL